MDTLRRWTVGLGLMMLVLAGCSKTDKRDGGKAGGPKDAGGGKDTLKVGAIFAVTGKAAFLGGPEQKTAEMMVEDWNKNGGLLGRKVELIVRDSEGSAEKAVGFAKQLIEEDKVVAIIGPSTTGESLKVKDTCQQNETPLLSCAAAENIVKPVMPYVFKTPQNDAFAAEKICAKIQALGLKKIGIVYSNDGFGTGGRDQLRRIAPLHGLEIAVDDGYDAKETDLTPLATKLKGAGVEAVVNWSIVAAQSIIVKNLRQIGCTAQLFQSHGFGNLNYVKNAGAAAEGIIFPCGRLLVADQLPDNHPQKALLMKYKTDYETKYNEPVSTFGGHAYDALIVLAEALKKAGTTDKAKLREAIEGLRGVPGTAGTFNFSPEDHNGLTLDAFEMLMVKGGKVTFCDK